MNSHAKEFETAVQTSLSKQSILNCAVLWLCLVAVELLPNLYGDWSSGSQIEINRTVRSGSVYVYWFVMSLTIGYWLLRYPIPPLRNCYRHLLPAMVLAFGYVLWSATSIKIFNISGFSALSFGELLGDHMVRFFLGELAVYAIIAGAWILSRRQPLIIVARDNDSSDKALTIRQNGKVRKIPSREIIRLQAMENYVVVHTSEEKLIHRSTLKGTLAQLGDDFIQVHRSSAVNIVAMKQFHYSENTLELFNGELVPVGRRRIATVTKHFQTHSQSA